VPDGSVPSAAVQLAGVPARAGRNRSATAPIASAAMAVRSAAGPELPEVDLLQRQDLSVERGDRLPEGLLLPGAVGGAAAEDVERDDPHATACGHLGAVRTVDRYGDGVRVVVVGAGFSGLMAASELVEGGHDVAVLEARDRVGGRVWSQELVPGDPRTVIERGAEFVLPGNDVLRAVVSRLGLELADMGMSYAVREVPAYSEATQERLRHAADAMAIAARTVDPGTSLAQLAESVVGAGSVPSEDVHAVVSRLVVTNGTEPDLLAADCAAESVGVMQRSRSYRVAGGNQRIADGLAERLGSALRRRTAVRAVERGPDGVRVLTEDGEIEGDAVVLAVPLALLSDLDLRPALPAPVTAAWRRAGRADNAKLHVPARSTVAGHALQPSAVQDVEHRFWTWTACDASGLVQPVLHAFAGSPSATRDLGVSDDASAWLAAAQALRPHLELDGDRALVTSWAADPWARMSYSAQTVHSEPGDEALLRAAVGPVHLAGEHTAGEWAGYMEGALRSGLRVAQEIGPRAD
jgi:monoamine oxidase